VRQDNPWLTTHEAGEPNPLRVVMSRTLDLPKAAHLWDTQDVKTLVITEEGANPDFQQFLQNKGVEVAELSPLTPAQVMAYFYERQFLSVLWECGGTLAANAITDGSIHKILAFIAPKIIGGKIAPSPVGDLGFTLMTEALSLERMTWGSVGCDFWIESYLS
jgi:diaminohydroxyphosphoribosylaminopyrimidine deaminase / 5-amino-6-(5-phosphoribosylamino)uracil reductase